MNWSFPWIDALKTRGAARRPDEHDPADMGTAFGLDASFGPVSPDDGRRELAPAPAAPAWEHRLTRRSSL